MLAALLRNHPLANLSFGLVLVAGFLTYGLLPRQQDPTINFNWIMVTTVLPGASALDVEKKVTDPLEDAIRGIANVKFVSSNSRESVSSLLVRFDDIDDRTFDKRLADLRREIQNAEVELPTEAEDPLILEITSANAFPTATIAVVGEAYDENLRRQAHKIEKDLERLTGVDRVDPIGAADPELHVDFDPAALEALAVSPGQVADTVAAFFQDVAAGSARQGGADWLVRLAGSDREPARLAARPVVGAAGEVRIGDVAEVQRAREKAAKLARVDGRPAVVLALMKKENASTLGLVERLRGYLDGRNRVGDQTGKWDATVAGTTFEQIYTENNGKVDGVVSANDTMAGGIVARLDANGLAGKVPVTGQDASVEGLQRILAGTQCMTVYKDTNLEAKAASDLAIALINGDTATADSLATGEVEDTVLGTKVPSALAIPEIIYADNVKKVVDDGFQQASDICTAEYAKYCQQYGVQ